MGWPRVFTAFTVIASFAACEWRVPHEPCDENGVGEGVIYSNGEYLTAYGEMWAKVGERPFEGCRVLIGDIKLHGVLSDFSDFDPFEEIGGFYDLGVDLPVPPDRYPGGVITGFPNLKRITIAAYAYSSAATNVEGGLYYDGFGALEYVEGDFSCAGPEPLGTELRVVTGVVGCPEERLGKLEHAGSISYKGHPLPSLRTVGELEGGGIADPAHIELPLLETVGGPNAVFPRHLLSSPYSGNLVLAGTNAVTFDLSSLRSVAGRLEVFQFWNIDLGVAEDDRGDEMRRRLSDVEIGGYRNICWNGPNDPCPWEESCETIHGEGALECCTQIWPECVGDSGDGGTM